MPSLTFLHIKFQVIPRSSLTATAVPSLLSKTISYQSIGNYWKIQEVSDFTIQRQLAFLLVCFFKTWL